MADNGRRQGGGRDAAAVLLAQGRTVRDTAAALDIGERTVTRWRADAGFRGRVVELRAELVYRALGRLADGLADAADTLRKLTAADLPPAVRLGAAKGMLEIGIKYVSIEELQRQIDDLKDAMNGGGQL